MKEIIQQVQVNIPFWMLMDGYLEKFLELGLNPEIGMDARSLDGFSVDDVQAVARRFREKGARITVHGPFMDLAPTSPDPAIREVTARRFDQLFTLLPALKPVSLVVHAGYDPRRHFSMVDEWLELSLDFFDEMALKAARFGCYLFIENVFEEHPEELLPLIDGLDGRAGICLDVGHLNAYSPVPLSAWLDTLGPCIGQFHLHDNAGDKDRHLPMGRGTLDFETLFAFIRQTHPILTLEPHEEKDLYESLDYLKRMLF